MTLSVIVNGGAALANQPTFSQNNISLVAGQGTTVYISGNGNYYVGSNSNPSIASVAINGSTAIVSAIGSGNANVTICQNGGQCSVLLVSVSGTIAQNFSITLSSSSLSVLVGNPATFSVSASNFTNPSYSLSDSFLMATISNANINSNGIFSWTPATSDVGTHNITVYASDSYGHSANATTQIIVSQQQTPVMPATPYFLRYLGYGDKGQDVLSLQKYLLQQGFLSATPTGRYGPATVAAMKKFQQAHSLKQVGVVGPATKDLLNQLISFSPASSSQSDDSLKQQQILQLQQQIQQLQAQISSMH